MSLNPSKNYSIANDQLQKEPIIILSFEGVPFIISSGDVYSNIRYDDPGIYYDGIYNYDGLRKLDPDKFKGYIDRKGSFSTISQKLEQWDGKASVETFNIKVIDKDGLITQICSPGVIIPEILNCKVRIYFGYQTISYPEDYLLLFRGYVNGYQIGQGFVNFTFTDPSAKRKDIVFNGSTSTLTNAISNTDTALVVSSTDNFYKTILNAKGVNDSTVIIGIILDKKEICYYTNAGIVDATHINVVRGQYGTLAINHSAGVSIDMFFFVTDNPVNIALKMMLSGWNGPCISSLKLRGIVNTDDALFVNDTITFPQGVDAIRDYGLSLGDFIILSGSLIPGNNGTFTVSAFLNSNRTVRFVETGILTIESPGVGQTYLDTVCAIRSKYDVYPIEAGLQLDTEDVLVSAHEYARNTFVTTVFKLPVMGDEKSGKQFIEEHLFKPVGAYSLTQGASISMGVSHPPLFSDKSKYIDASNVVNAKGIMVERGIDSRFMYNEIIFNYDYDVIQDSFNQTLYVEDADAQSRTKKIATLQIDVRGFDGLGDDISQMKSRALRLLQRYKYSAETISLSTFFGTGHTIDSGDTIVLNDTVSSVLQIANTDTGSRGVYNRIMEVQERSINLSNGQANLKLLSNNGFAFTDRYAVIGPASWLDTTYSHTTTLLRIQDSFGSKFPGAEYLKWQAYEGSTIRVHDNTYTQDAETTFTLDSVDEYKMHLSPALPFTPTSGMVVEFCKYNSNPLINQLPKQQFVSLDSTSPILSASSSTVFVLQSGYASRYSSGMFIYVQSPDCTRYSPNVKILTIVGDVVTIGPVTTGGSNPNLGFTPSSGDLVHLGGFGDGGNGYKYI
jgi:hypothetical protein